MLTRAYLEEVSFSLLAEGTVHASKAQYSFQSRKPILRTTQVISYTSQLLCVSWYISCQQNRPSLKCPNSVEWYLFYLIIKMVILCSVHRAVGSRNKEGFDGKSKSSLSSSNRGLMAWNSTAGLWFGNMIYWFWVILNTHYIKIYQHFIKDL